MTFPCWESACLVSLSLTDEQADGVRMTWHTYNVCMNVMYRQLLVGRWRSVPAYFTCYLLAQPIATAPVDSLTQSELKLGGCSVAIGGNENEPQKSWYSSSIGPGRTVQKWTNGRISKLTWQVSRTIFRTLHEGLLILLPRFEEVIFIWRSDSFMISRIWGRSVRITAIAWCVGIKWILKSVRFCNLLILDEVQRGEAPCWVVWQNMSQHFKVSSQWMSYFPNSLNTTSILQNVAYTMTTSQILL